MNSFAAPRPKLVLIFATLCAVLASVEVKAQKLDFGDDSSTTITTKAWNALNAKKYGDAVGYAQKCVELYQKDALEMQHSLKEPVKGDRNAVSKMWALNDAGTCLFILGQALEKQGKSKDALESYKRLVEKLPFAQCWDPKGWFWKPAEAARKRISELEYDTLK